MNNKKLLESMYEAQNHCKTMIELYYFDKKTKDIQFPCISCKSDCVHKKFLIKD